jgi:hypothetical protein
VRAPTAGAEGCGPATEACDKQWKRGVGQWCYAVSLSFIGAAKPGACCKRNIEHMHFFCKMSV